LKTYAHGHPSVSLVTDKRCSARQSSVLLCLYEKIINLLSTKGHAVPSAVCGCFLGLGCSVTLNPLLLAVEGEEWEWLGI